MTLAAMGAAFLLSACATSPTGGDGTRLDGKLVSLKDGVVMPFQIERTRASGGLWASNPQTGESFEGQYTGMIIGGGAEGRGFLRGTKGTVINVVFDIQTGWRPRGSGVGQDNRGNRYQVQF